MRGHIAASVLFLLGTNLVYAQERQYHCVDGEEARELFLSNELAKAPNYSESAGARVQRQHPTTTMFGHAKYIDHQDDSPTAMVCNYSNHVGSVAIYIGVGARTATPLDACDAGDCGAEPYWRQEYIESYPEQDQLGREQLYVCMFDRDGVAYPNVGCGFILPE